MTNHDLAAVARRLRITRPLVSLDVETTGTALGVDRIIQIGIQKARTAPCACGGYQGCDVCFGDGFTVDVTEWSQFIDPQLPIPAEATLTHKITNEMVAGSPTWGELAGGIATGLTDVDFVGQNVKFDLRFLDAEMKRVGRPWSYAEAHILDTKRLDEIFYPRTLDVLVRKYLDCDITEHHDALADVRWTSSVLAAQLDAFETLTGAPLPATVAELSTLLFPRDPSWVDAAGKLVWRNGEACFGFGKWNGVPLKQVPKDYLAWIGGQDFPADVKTIIRNAITGKFPARAIQEAA